MKRFIRRSIQMSVVLGLWHEYAIADELVPQPASTVASANVEGFGSSYNCRVETFDGEVTKFRISRGGENREFRVVDGPGYIKFAWYEGVTYALLKTAEDDGSAIATISGRGQTLEFVYSGVGVYCRTDAG
ncbi:MAG: hypothetical protein NTV34_15830 [Proteobacteria bacterium]|nr:hypothetical protein [Pseudomonadota bacterium]